MFCRELRKATTFYLYDIKTLNGWSHVTEVESVYRAVRTESLYIKQKNFVFKGLNAVPLSSDIQVCETGHAPSSSADAEKTRHGTTPPLYHVPSRRAQGQHYLCLPLHLPLKPTVFTILQTSPSRMHAYLSYEQQTFRHSSTYESVKITNKMQPCNRVYYSKVYWRLSMFRAAYRSSSGALNCICSLWFIYTCGDRPLSRLSGKWIIHFSLSLDNGLSPHVYVKQRLQIPFRAPDDERCAARNMLSLQ